jgi:hypothetical protein
MLQPFVKRLKMAEANLGFGTHKMYVKSNFAEQDHCLRQSFAAYGQLSLVKTFWLNVSTRATRENETQTAYIWRFRPIRSAASAARPVGMVGARARGATTLGGSRATGSARIGMLEILVLFQESDLRPKFSFKE